MACISTPLQEVKKQLNYQQDEQVIQITGELTVGLTGGLEKQKRLCFFIRPADLNAWMAI